MAKNTQKTVKALFSRDKKILLVQDHKGVWELPGGRIEPGETPEEALRRELREELSWNKVDIKDIVDEWEFTSKNTGNTFKVMIFTCFSGEGGIKKNDEYIKYAWMPVNEIDSLDMQEGYKKSIKKYLS